MNGQPHRALTISVLFVAAACGGKATTANGAPVADFSGAAPSTTTVSNLSPAQAQALCEDVQQYVGSIFTASNFEDAYCRTLAIQTAFLTAGFSVDPNQANPMVDDAAFAAACQASYDQCKMQGIMGIEFDGQMQLEDADCSNPEFPPDCNVTVGQLEQCLTDTNDVYAGLLNDVPSCNGITVASAVTAIGLFEAMGDIEQPASCTAIDSCDTVAMSDVSIGMPPAGTAPLAGAMQ